ncbi:hypothetical protein E2562_038236 [Oryza meyeriana var. granulata]|uniref:Uncharacterized protein n=1 Tax=Oryza meyeriana var. granulata TaxID=110450 RepID=A0A6G1E8J8_9ORYZ|nr:hypothetical protein E2562_038236 [Oryza meyeriana var. granulata]
MEALRNIITGGGRQLVLLVLTLLVLAALHEAPIMASAARILLQAPQYRTCPIYKHCPPVHAP